MLRRYRRSTKRETCETLKFSSLSAEFAANVVGVTTSAASFFGGAFSAAVAYGSYGQKYGSDVAALSVGCDDIPFDEIKELLDAGFNDVNRNVDRNFDAVRENLQAIRRNNFAIDQVKSKVDETLKTVTQAFAHIDDEFVKISSLVQEGFDKLQALVRKYKIEEVTTDLITFIEDFTMKTNGLKDFSYGQRVTLLEGENGYLKYFKTAANPQGALSLYALLNRILIGKFAEPKSVDDNAAHLALYLLYSGTETYINLLRFLLDGYKFLGLYYYGQGNVDVYNRYYFLSVITVKEFQNTLYGVGSQAGIVNKVTTVLDKVRALNVVNNGTNIQDIISHKIQYFKTSKADFKISDLQEEQPSRQILCHFTNSEVKTPFLEWQKMRKVRYAVQYVHDGLYSPVGNWSLPYTIGDKACPNVEIGEAPPGTTRVIFRRFDQETPQLVSTVSNPHQTEFRDIDRDLYEAGLEGNEALALVNTAILIKDGANITASFEHGHQAIHAATRAANVAVLRELVNRGANINARDDRGYTPLHISAESGNEKFVKELINLGSDVRATSHSNWTAFHVAAKRGHTKTLKVLLEAELVDLNAKARGGFTPLHVAVSSRKKRAVQMLSETDKADINAQSDELVTPLHLAVLGNQEDTVPLLLRNSRSDNNARARGGLTALHLATVSGDIPIVELISQHNATDVNAKSDDGWTALHLAVSLKNDGVIKTLLNVTNIDMNNEAKDKLTPLHLASRQSILARDLVDRGAHLEARDSRGYSPLHFAVEHEHLDTVKSLVGKGANVNSKDDRGYTSLGMAVLKENLNTMEFLLDKNADVNSQNTDGKSLLSIAVLSGNLDVVKILVAKGAVFGHEILRLAAVNKHWDLVKYLILDKRTLNNGGTALHSAAQLGDLSVVIYVVESGIDVNAGNKFSETPLHFAVCARNLEVVKYLIQKGGQTTVADSDGNTALHLAARESELDIVTCLFTAGASIVVLNNNGQSPLHMASAGGKSDNVNFLLRKGAKVAAKDTLGETALHAGVSSGNLDVVKYLIGNGARVNEQNIYGKTPLHIAVGEGKQYVEASLTQEAFVGSEILRSRASLNVTCRDCKLEILNYLLTKGADIDAKDEINETPLYSGLHSKNVNGVKVLIDNGANVDVCNLYSVTPLMIAVRWGNFDVVTYLAEKMVDVHKTCTNFKETPLALAASKGFLEIVVYLKSKGSDINRCNRELISPLHHAAASGNLELVKYLVNSGCNVNAKTFSGLTPLEYGVAIKGNVDVVKFLVKEGSVYDATRILYLAVMSGNLETIKYFVESGCDTKIRDSEGDTLLHFATKYCELDILEYLVEKGLDINAKNDEGKTPLFMVAERSDKVMLEFLVANGADLNATDESGGTVLCDVFQFNPCDRDISDYLIEKGALCPPSSPYANLEVFRHTQCDSNDRNKRSIGDNNSQPGFPVNQVFQEMRSHPATKSDFSSHPVKSVVNQDEPRIAFKSESSSYESSRRNGAAVFSGQSSYLPSVNENILLAKCFLYLFGRKSFVKGMNKVERAARGGRREEADWAETYLRQGLVQYGKQQ